MTVQYQMRLYDTAGSLQAVFDDWNSVYIYPRVNDFGYHTISIDGTDPRRALFVFDAIIEVWRRDQTAGIPWYIEYAGFHRTSQDQISDKGTALFTSYGRAFEDLIHRREVLYPATTSGDTKSGPADDIIKAYARENAGPAALAANGRARDGVVPGFTVAADIGSAPTWSGSAAWKNLLTAIQTIANTTPLDFWVTRTGVTFLLDVRAPRRGLDRTGAGAAAPVVFSLARQNMSQPFAVETRTDEVNVVVVLGPGTDTNREIVIRTSTDRLLSPWNDAEKTFDARNTASAALGDAGDAHLQQLRATKHVTFTALNTHALVYGRDYFVGDLVLATFAGIQQPKKLLGVEITIANGTEDIRHHFDDEVAT